MKQKGKIKKSLMLLCSCALFLGSAKTNQIFAKVDTSSEFSRKTLTEIENVYDSLPVNLKAKNIDSMNESNIMIYDENGKIINEIHLEYNLVIK